MNIQGGIGGATTGAQLGANFGGYGAAIGAGVGLLAGLFSSDPNKARLKAQEKYNALVVQNTATALFDRERAQQVERMRTARALRSYQEQGKVQRSTVNANYGARDLIGSSAVALEQAIDYQTQQALASQMFNYGVNFDNYMTDIDAITNRGTSSLQQSIEGTQNKPLDIASVWQAGKDAYSSAQSLYYKATGGGKNYGLQFGNSPPVQASQNTWGSDYSFTGSLTYDGIPNSANISYLGL